MQMHGSDYWTFTLPRRVGLQAARDIAASCTPMSCDEAAQYGIVDTVLSRSCSGFDASVAREAQSLASDPSRVAAILARKKAALSVEALEDMHRCRLYESMVMKDNLKEAGHVALRRQRVEKLVPLSTPAYLSGQSKAFGRILDGKQLAALKMQRMKQEVVSMREVRACDCDVTVV